MPYIGKSPSAGVRQRYQYTATAGQTTFTGTDLGNLTLTYTDNNFVDVFQNGVLLKGGGTDYTATSGTSVVLTTGASVSDVIEIIVYDVFSVGNFYNRTDSDSRYVNVDGDTMTGTLALNVSGSSHLTTTTSGTSNLVLGVNAGNSITSGGNNNVALGDEAGTALTTGDLNTFVGMNAGATISTQSNNTAVGAFALDAGTGDDNVAIGAGALGSASFAADNNVAVGKDAGNSVTTGEYNTIVGALAGDAITSGGRNTLVGYKAGSTINDSGGLGNTLMGYEAGDAIANAADNVAVGDSALGAEAGGQNNVAIGKNALLVQSNSSGNIRNTAVGSGAGSAVTTGADNTFLGGQAGDTTTTGSRNTVLGKGADLNDSADDTIVIGATCVSASNGYITMGRGSGTERIYNLPTSNASWSHSSDERFKKDITTNTDCGLDFINELRTVTYKWKAPSELDKSFSSYDKDKTEASYANKIYGLIAQEVKSAMDKHNITNFDGWGEVGDEKIQSISEAMFVFPLIKAVQELSAKNDALEARIKKLEDG
jgi:hypothetical protein